MPFILHLIFTMLTIHPSKVSTIYNIYTIHISVHVVLSIKRDTVIFISQVQKFSDDRTEKRRKQEERDQERMEELRRLMEEQAVLDKER